MFFEKITGNNIISVCDVCVCVCVCGHYLFMQGSRSEHLFKLSNIVEYSIG
jgi:hypothetical protein